MGNDSWHDLSNMISVFLAKTEMGERVSHIDINRLLTAHRAMQQEIIACRERNKHMSSDVESALIKLQTEFAYVLRELEQTSERIKQLEEEIANMKNSGLLEIHTVIK